MNNSAKIQLPEACRFIIDRLDKYGYQGYAVGGCVRDSLMRRQPNDWDITTNALPEQLLEIFSDLPVIKTGLKHGTVTVMIEHEPFEVTTFRIDGNYSDGRHPDRVSFTSSITDDLARRDFTVNAMAYNEKTGLVDPFGGVQDLERKIIRCVGEPERRFREDALRLLRAVRFSAALGFSIEKKTLSALKTCSPTITLVAKERIFSELKKTVIAPYVSAALRTAPDPFFAAIPELAVIQNTPQNSRYHIYDVWEHTLHALEHISPDVTSRLAVLFHDVGKGICRMVGKDGYDHFYGHALHSAKLTYQALKTLRCDNKTLQDVVALVELHDTHFPMRQAKFRRLLSRLGYPLFFKLLDVSRADSLSHAPWCIDERCNALTEAKQEATRLQQENYCLTLKQLAITGRDLIELGLNGKEIGEVLNSLLDTVIIGQIPNDRAILLKKAEHRINRKKNV